MNLNRATTYMFKDPKWFRKFGLILLVSPVPLIGQLYALGYANHTLRRLIKGHDETDLPDLKLAWPLARRGIGMLIVALICQLIVAVLAAPLFFNATDDETTTSTATSFPPAIVQAFDGPSELLVTVAATVLTAVVIARYALTGSGLSGFDPFKLWALLRAEPAVWITYSVFGFVLTEGAAGIAWLLPFHGGWDIAATIVTSTIIWSYGTMINVHLIAQAYLLSSRTAALRAAEVRLRW